jgi:kynurenine formamidase
MCSPAVAAAVRASFSRRGVLGVGAALAAGALSAKTSAARQATPVAVGGATGTIRLGPASSIVDLSHVITEAFPMFPGTPGPEFETLVTIPENGYYGLRLMISEHTGTHMDAPGHFIEGGAFAEQLPVAGFVAPLAVIDIAERAATDPDAQLTPDDILAWESANGPLPAGAFVAMRSSWDAKVDDADAFLNLDADGVLHFPGIHPDAAALLVEERDIVGAGVDTVSLDFGASTDFGAHLTLLGAGKYGLENLAALAAVPAAGATIIVGGPKHREASGGPSRVFAVF